MRNTTRFYLANFLHSREVYVLCIAGMLVRLPPKAMVMEGRVLRDEMKITIESPAVTGEEVDYFEDDWTSEAKSDVWDVVEDEEMEDEWDDEAA